MPSAAAARTANGYVLNVAAARRKILLDAAGEEATVAEVVPDFTHSRSHPLVCFTSFDDGTITHLALGRRGHRAGTGLRRLNLRDLTKLSTPVAYAALLERIPRRVRAHVQNRFAEGGLLPPGSFVAVVDAIRDMLPESNRILERFSARRQSEIADLGPKARQALASSVQSRRG